jgi:hypothetical protein
MKHLPVRKTRIPLGQEELLHLLLGDREALLFVYLQFILH